MFNNKMAGFVVLALVALICQASAQICKGPNVRPVLPTQSPRISPVVPNLPLRPVPKLPSISPVVSVPKTVLPVPTGISCQPIPRQPPVISTTVVDNNLANSLANTLQLLVIGELLEDARSRAPVYPPYVLAPAAEVTTVTAEASASAVSVSGSPITSSSVEVETEASINKYSPVITDISAPVNAFSQNVYAPSTDIIAQAPVTEILAPVSSSVTNIYGPVTEISSSATSASSVDMYTSINDINAISVASAANPLNSPYYGVNDYVQASASASAYASGFTDYVAPLPISTYVPDFYSGYADVYTPLSPYAPIPAEIYLPQQIPAQIVCNFYGSPSSNPLVSLTVEPLSPIGGYTY